MANAHNLIRNEDRTPSERRENARKAGKASGEARRKKKAFKDALLAVLESKNKEGKSYQDIVAMGFVKRLATGDPRSIELMLQIIGEYPDADSFACQREDDGLKEALDAAACEVCTGADDSDLLPEDDDGEEESI